MYKYIEYSHVEKPFTIKRHSICNHTPSANPVFPGPSY